MAILEAREIHHAFGDRPVLKDISLSFNQGELVSLLGPNGSGKTTLLKILLGLLPPSAGQVFYGGQPITGMPAKRYARLVAYVPQIHRTAFPYSVEEVVAMGRIPHHSPWRTHLPADAERIEKSLARLDIAHLRKRPYTEISGGERQLTLIARALAQDAKTLIMDEPTAALDFGHQVRLIEQLAKLADDGYTIIKSTHAPEHALWVARRVILLMDGRILGDGKPKEQLSSENLQTMYRIHARVAPVEGGLLTCLPRDLAVPR